MKKIVVAITGASGSIYAKRLIHYLDRLYEQCSYEVVFSKNAIKVWEWELKETPKLKAKVYNIDDYFAPFASGSAKYDAMVIIPASMGTIARITHGISDNLITRAADVFIKEKRQLIIVFREAPLSTLHLKNLLTLSKAGATIFPAAPSFYSNPNNINEIIDTIVLRILDHLGLQIDYKRWGT